MCACILRTTTCDMFRYFETLVLSERQTGRTQLSWEDSVKRDLRKAEEEEKWRETANNRKQQKNITKITVQ